MIAVVKRKREVGAKLEEMKIPLCLECHSDVPSFHDVSRPRYQNCQNCHAAVHGSNRDPRLFEE